MKRAPKISCITKKEKRKNSFDKLEMMTLDILPALYNVYKKIGQLFFHTYLITCLNKDISVLIKAKISEQAHKLSIKTMVLTF